MGADNGKTAMERLKDVKELLDAGLISEGEFQEKKKEIMKSI